MSGTQSKHSHERRCPLWVQNGWWSNHCVQMSAIGSADDRGYWSTVILDHRSVLSVFLSKHHQICSPAPEPSTIGLFPPLLADNSTKREAGKNIDVHQTPTQSAPLHRSLHLLFVWKKSRDPSAVTLSDSLLSVDISIIYTTEGEGHPFPPWIYLISAAWSDDRRWSQAVANVCWVSDRTSLNNIELESACFCLFEELSNARKRCISWAYWRNRTWDELSLIIGVLRIFLVRDA